MHIGVVFRFLVYSNDIIYVSASLISLILAGKTEIANDHSYN
jgi:hypothetical protein